MRTPAYPANPAHRHPSAAWCWLLALLLAALPAVVGAQIRFTGPTLGLDRYGASAGVSVSATAGRLDTSKAYRLGLRNAGGTQTLVEIPTNSGKALVKFAVPSVAAGGYQVVLLEVPDRGLPIDRALVKFSVQPGLTVTPGSPAQAGRSMLVTVGNLAAGSLSLSYGGKRVVYGPVDVPAGSHAFKFVVPSDIPASLPANVALAAANTVSGKLARTGSTTVPVAAPRLGSFGSFSGLTVSKPTLAPRERFAIGGKLSLAEGTHDDVQLQAFWIGSDGSRMPISTRGLTIAADGSFNFDALAPSLGAMSANVPSGSGHVRVVGSYMNEHGRREYTTVEGPDLTLGVDVDNDVDINVTVIRHGTQVDEALEGAVVTIGPAAPVALFELPAQDPDAGTGAQSGVGLSNASAHLALTQYGNHASEGPYMAAGAVNQFEQNLPTWQPPQPACGPTLRRKTTNAEGKAEFVLEYVPDSNGMQFMESASAVMMADLCEMRPGPDGTLREYCDAATPRFHSFDITIHSLHTGAGVRDDNGAEVPTRLAVVYDSEDKDFEVTFPNGQVRSYQTSANILVTLNQIAAGTEHLPLGEMWMYTEVPGVAYYDVPKTGNTFGPFVNFSKTPNVVFQYDDARRFLRFKHIPGVVGPLTSAEFHLQSKTGQMNKIGNFTKRVAVPGCQPDAGAEEWEFAFANFDHFLRFPDGVFIAQGQDKRCGYIEARNALGHVGRKNVCLQWQDPGTYPAGTTFTANDAEVGRTTITGDIQTAHQRTDAPAPPPLLGEPLGVGATRNEGRGYQSVHDEFGVGGKKRAGREFTGDNDAQFNRNASDHNEEVDFNIGSPTVEIGEDEWQTIVDVTIPLLRWYWGIPELVSAEIFIDLRLLAQYYVYGTLKYENDRERLDMVTSALFSVMLFVGIDLDVLFGLFFDAGATIIGTIASELPVQISNGQVTVNQPCFTFRLDFYGWFDPAPLLPTPVVEVNENMLKHKDPAGCGFWNGSPKYAGGYGVLKDGVFKGSDPDDRPLVPFQEVRTVFRHPELAFDTAGNGALLRLDDAQQLVADPLDSEGLTDAPSQVLSTARGLRHARLAFHGDGDALAVWVESALSNAAFDAASTETRTRNQRLMWSTWDGSSWTAKAVLASAAGGIAHVALAACPQERTACGPGGKISAVWQRREIGMSPVVSRLSWAEYRPSTGWGAVADVATAAASAGHDLTPAITSMSNGEALVVWIRAPHWVSTDKAQVLAALDGRQLMYRLLSTGTAQQVETSSLRRVSMPSVLGLPSSRARLAFTRADNSTGFIGTRQALYLADGTCGSGTCTWAWKRATDQANRAIYGERPRVLPDRDGGEQVVMRTFHFGPAANQPAVVPGDPLGTVLVSGDLMAIRGNFSTGVVRHLPLTADGALHMAPAAAFDPSSGKTFALSSVRAPELAAPVRAAVKSLGAATVRGFATSKAVSGGLELHAAASAPDLGVGAVALLAAPVEGGGGTVSTTVNVFNRGSDYDPALHGVVQLIVHWDSPVPQASALRVDLAALAAGASRDVPLSLPVPAGHSIDAEHRVYATLSIPPETEDLDGANNQAIEHLAGLPVPQGLRSEIVRGVPFVQLAWPMPVDARVAGFVVYVEEADGSQHVLGSTATNGFLDLAARFDAPRTYRVASYSARGVESEKSAPITANSVPAGLEPLLKDGFEDPPVQ